MLNSMGVEIMKRNGFFDPGGEVVLGTEIGGKGVSKITDIAMGEEGAWTILDSKRARLYTYDQNGNLLFAFGDEGNMVGNGVKYVALAYQVLKTDDDLQYNLIILDDTGETGFKLTVYTPTEYCESIMTALRNQNNHNYAATIDNWQEVLTKNNNFDLAYIGIGKALFNQGKYDEAMKMLSSAYETDYYSKSFMELRKDLISKWMIPMIAAMMEMLSLSRPPMEATKIL
jgi:tetratricopeptide (TPR) repeat protein